MATDDLNTYLRETWPVEGVGPITQAQRGRIHEAAARISELEAQLAARDAEIAAWLRKGFDTYPHGTYARCSELQSYWNAAAEGVERGDYAKGQTDAQQGD